MGFIPKFQYGPLAPLPLPRLSGFPQQGLPTLPWSQVGNNSPVSKLPTSISPVQQQRPEIASQMMSVKADPRCPNGGHWNDIAQMCVPDFNNEAGFSDYASAAYNTVDNELQRGSSMFQLLGQATTGMANAPGFKPNVGLGVAGGAFSGLASGGILGGIVGAGAGFLTSAKKRTEYETLRDLYERQRFDNKKVSQNLGYYAQFGGDTPGTTPAQTEKGEIVLFPDNTLPDVMASKYHKNMNDDKITDMLPDGSYIFSNDKTMKFDVKDVKEKVLGYGMSYYDEQGNYKTEEMEMEDFLPKRGKMTFAEAAEALRKMIKTTGNRKDLFDVATDSENLETRVPYLMQLIAMQDEKNRSAGRVGSELGPEMPEMQYGSTWAYASKKNLNKQYGGETKKKGPLYVLAHTPMKPETIEEQRHPFDKDYAKFQEALLKNDEELSQDHILALDIFLNTYVDKFHQREQKGAFEFNEKANQRYREVYKKLRKAPKFYLPRVRSDIKKLVESGELGTVTTLRNTGKDKIDETFSKELQRGLPILQSMYEDVIPIYVQNKQQYRDSLAKIPKNANVMFMDHSGDRFFGVPYEDFTQDLISLNPAECIGGSCYGGSLFMADYDAPNHPELNSKDLRKALPKTKFYMDQDAWEGFDASRKGMEQIVYPIAKQFGGPAERKILLERKKIQDTFPEPAPNRDMLGPIGEPGARAFQAALSLLGTNKRRATAAAHTTEDLRSGYKSWAPPKDSPNFQFYNDLRNDSLLDKVYSVYDQYDIKDPSARAFLFMESKGDPKAKSKAGYTGLFQLHPKTSGADWNQFAKDHPEYENIKINSAKDLEDPKVNSTVGQWYFGTRVPEIIRSFGFDKASNISSLVAAAYNMGPGNLKKHLNKYPRKNNETDAEYVKRLQKKFPEETKNYVDRYWMGYNRFSNPRELPRAQYGSTWTIK